MYFFFFLLKNFREFSGETRKYQVDFGRVTRKFNIRIFDIMGFYILVIYNSIFRQWYRWRFMRQSRQCPLWKYDSKKNGFLVYFSFLFLELTFVVNKIEEEGARSFAEVLRYNSSLATLSLKGTCQFISHWHHFWQQIRFQTAERKQLWTIWKETVLWPN